MSVFAVERQRRFSLRWRAAWRTRFSCCLMFGIGVKTPAAAGPEMVAAAGESAVAGNLLPWTRNGPVETVGPAMTAGREPTAAREARARLRAASAAPARIAARARIAAPARTAAAAPDRRAAYAHPVSDADRERELRRLERDRRRRERGLPTYFDDAGATFESWPLLTEMSEQPTMVIRPALLRDGAGAPGTAQPPRRLAVSTAIFSLATGLSRVLGLVREVVASYYFGAAGQDQRLHGRVPDPEPRPRARRRRRALVGVRPRLQRAAREGRAEARLAGRLEPLLADAARADAR